jgi:hypothetical protein
MCLRRRNAPSSPRSLQRSASAKSVRFSVAENCRRVAISITSGSAPLSAECAMVEDRRTLGLTESIEEAERLFIEDFDTSDMTGHYLYSKYWRSGVSGHIDTGGSKRTTVQGFAASCHDRIPDSSRPRWWSDGRAETYASGLPTNHEEDPKCSSMRSKPTRSWRDSSSII